jgi:hypothetical protein
MVQEKVHEYITLQHIKLDGIEEMARVKHHVGLPVSEGTGVDARPGAGYDTPRSQVSFLVIPQ